tara:strand:+ start:315 stop:653 length:339 start_codon:yes stop_codon:yes gene_type:complete
MLKIKAIISILIFSSILIGTSIIKNQTRDIEKKINYLNKIIHLKEKDFYESQLDFFYLTSPIIIEKKIEHLDNHLYFPMEYSNIFLNMSSFLELKRKLVNQEHINERKAEKK